MSRARRRAPTVALLACAAAGALALGACSSLIPSKVDQPSTVQLRRIGAAARALTVDARRYEQVEPSVTAPFDWLSWHRQWLTPRPELDSLYAGFWRWHLASSRFLPRERGSATSDAEIAYRLAIGQWVGDQVNKFWMLRYCAPNGPGTTRIQACWESELHRHQAKWVADDAALRHAYAAMRGTAAGEFPAIIPRAGWLAG